jgi:hypothetical protein
MDNRYKTVPEAHFGTPEEHLRRLVQAVNGLQNGQGNNHFVVTLVPSAATTTVTSRKCNVNSAIQLSPMSASAALSFGTGLVWASAGDETVTINHNSSSVTDRDFAILVNG